MTLDDGDLPEEVGLLSKATFKLIQILLIDGALGIEDSLVVLVACHIGQSGVTSTPQTAIVSMSM